MDDKDIVEELEELGGLGGLESLNEDGDPQSIDELEDLPTRFRSGDNENLDDEIAPLEPWQALCFYLERFRVIKSGEGKPREEEALSFLGEGQEVKLPYVTTVQSELTPYRIYPIAAYRVINAAVKVLEKDLEKEIRGYTTDRLEIKTLIGIATLADTLFSGACTHPEGNFLIHRMDPKTGEISLKGHGRRIKQLATRLTRWRAVYGDMLVEKGTDPNLPELSCREIVAQEISSSLQRFKITQGANFEGFSPIGSTDSIEALRENMGLEPTAMLGERGGSDEEAETWETEVAQASWMGLDIPHNIRGRDTIRGNVISESPRDWIWTYEESPLDFVVNYVCAHAKPCLEEAHSLLIEASENPNVGQLGTYALTLDPKSKVNPDSYWKIIKRISHHFPSSKPETDNISKKLDTARFILSLDAINKKLNIDAATFQRNYQQQVYEAIDKSKSSNEPITRNAILLKAIDLTCPAMSQIEKEQWLENLQSFAVGAYENSKGMELERKKLLGRINHLFKTPREELEKVKHNKSQSQNAIEKLNTVIQSASNAFYKYLSGSTGQMTRRELRTKVQTMKKWAEQRGDAKLLEELNHISKFISSISSQIKSGQWYTKEKENKEILFNFLLTMLQTPKPLKGPEFLGSKEPEAKDPLEITIDFLRSFGEEKVLSPGKHAITEVIAMCKAREQADDGIQIADALKEITKNKTETLPVIKERERALAGAIDISEFLHNSKNPIKDIAEKFEEELEILATEESPTEDIDPFSDPSAPKVFEGKAMGDTEKQSAIIWLQKKAQEFKDSQDDPNFSQTPTWLKKVKETEHMSRKILESLAREKNTNQGQFNNDILKENRNLQRIINRRLEKNLSFWKGINYIGQNIQSRREAEKYQISPTGRGTLQNIIAIVKAKIQGREVAIDKDKTNKRITEDKTLRQFKVSRTRGRTLVTNAGVPIALWISKDIKGTKTKINKEDFLETLKSRHKACLVCLDLNKRDTSIEEKLHQFHEREKEDRNAINTHIIDQCITMLEDKEGLTKGLEYINSSRNKLSRISSQNPPLDTPNAIGIKAKEIANKENSKPLKVPTNELEGSIN